MRLWHYRLISVLPKDMLVSQWRECIAIKRQWEKGTLKHRLVKYVQYYNKGYFKNYFDLVLHEMKRRKIKYQDKFVNEIHDFCDMGLKTKYYNYPEHNERYLRQCYYNLQEKADRGIVSEEEWKTIEKFIRR